MATQTERPRSPTPEVAFAVARAGLSLGVLADALGLARAPSNATRLLTAAGIPPGTAAALATTLAALADLAVAVRPGIAFERLTCRELEVLELLALGLSDRAIAQRLRISPHTASTHVKSVRNKLGGGRRAAVTAQWLIGSLPWGNDRGQVD